MEKSEQIAVVRDIMKDISEYFVRENQPYIIMDGFEHIRDIVTLYAKQTNLLESLLLLLENNHTEESYILFRSLLNNHMLIEYLINDNENRDRYKEFSLQPVKSDLKFLRDVVYGINAGYINKSEVPNLKEKMNKFREYLLEQGVNPNEDGALTPLTIAQLARADKLLFGLYATHYRLASKYEHSDPSSLSAYWEKIDDEYSEKNVFVMNLSRSNTEAEIQILKTASEFYTLSFLNIVKFFNRKYEYLVKSMYDTEKLKQITAKIATSSFTSEQIMNIFNIKETQ